MIFNPEQVRQSVTTDEKRVLHEGSIKIKLCYIVIDVSPIVYWRMFNGESSLLDPFHKFTCSICYRSSSKRLIARQILSTGELC